MIYPTSTTIFGGAPFVDIIFRTTIAVCHRRCVGSVSVFDDNLYLINNHQFIVPDNSLACGIFCVDDIEYNIFYTTLRLDYLEPKHPYVLRASVSCL